MKKYIVFQNNEYHIVGANGFTPNNAVCPAPENEDISWLTIEDVIEEGQVIGKQAVVNEQLKIEILAEREAASLLQSQDESLRSLVRNAVSFGNKLMEDFVMENIALGITADNMSEAVLDAMAGVESALRTGTLHIAIKRIKEIPAESKDAKYITNARLLANVHKIEAYLNLPLSGTL